MYMYIEKYYFTQREFKKRAKREMESHVKKACKSQKVRDT